MLSNAKMITCRKNKELAAQVRLRPSQRVIRPAHGAAPDGGWFKDGHQPAADPQKPLRGARSRKSACSHSHPYSVGQPRQRGSERAAGFFAGKGIGLSVGSLLEREVLDSEEVLVKQLWSLSDFTTIEKSRIGVVALRFVLRTGRQSGIFQPTTSDD